MNLVLVTIFNDNLIYVQTAYQYIPTCDNNHNSVAYYCTFKKIIVYLF